jgi:mycothiol synthase
VYGEDEITLAGLREWFDAPDLVMLVAELADGRIAGYADLNDHAQERVRFAIDLRVPPGERAREIGGALLEAMEARAAQVAAPGASVRLWVPSTDDEARRFAESHGYEPFRYSFQMRIDFDGELPEPEWPEGIAVRTFVPGQDDEVVYEAHQDSFADHFEHAPWPFESWRRWALGESFDPTLWYVAEDGPQIAGVCFCRIEGGAGGERGWVNVLGVRPPWRKRGLGRALLLGAFAEFRARGKSGAGLGVDGLNTTGAVRLYEQAGMYVARRSDQYRKSLDA